MFSFFFFLRTDRKTFILSTARDIKLCNIQRFIEVIGVCFLVVVVFFRQMGQKDPCLTDFHVAFKGGNCVK